MSEISVAANPTDRLSLSRNWGKSNPEPITIAVITGRFARIEDCWTEEYMSVIGRE